ncbi:DUF7848 domain-containing protein [Actinacidiphila glaucinigra]|uniref:DUF7848 domain-containing protein n=1 Tax=Actinacidiphila glaucinigra TaxID=235986 RepID=UPI004057FD26
MRSPRAGHAGGEELESCGACTSCAAPGVPDEDAEAAQAWTFAHLAAHPTHTGFREEITRHWRADLVPGPTSPAVPVARRVIT